MYLILGDPSDPCCRKVHAALATRNHPARYVADPLMQSRFTWTLDNECSASRLTWDDEISLSDDEITGVLVRNTNCIDPTGWLPQDLAYMQAETQAALLAWLWSLACPVVNRYHPTIWYGQQSSLLSWQRLLRRCGLSTVETLITNVEQEALEFGGRISREGIPGAVYAPLTSQVRYLVASDDDWNGLANMQRSAPVSLAFPSGAPQFVCVVGRRVVWEGTPAPAMSMLEPALCDFASAAGLVFLEMALAVVATSVCVIAVEPRPRFERFGESAQALIVESLVDLLTAEEDDNTSPRWAQRLSS